MDGRASDDLDFSRRVLRHRPITSPFRFSIAPSINLSQRPAFNKEQHITIEPEIGRLYTSRTAILTSQLHRTNPLHHRRLAVEINRIAQVRKHDGQSVPTGRGLAYGRPQAAVDQDVADDGEGNAC